MEENRFLCRYYDVQYSAGVDEWENSLGPGRGGY